jgi:hypothetical protein
LVTEVKVAASSSFTVVFDASVFDSGNGACDTTQQEVLPAVMLCAACSPMSILSHWDWVCADAQFPSVDEKSAQRESGFAPATASPKTSTDMSSLFTA